MSFYLNLCLNYKIRHELTLNTEMKVHCIVGMKIIWRLCRFDSLVFQINKSIRIRILVNLRP